MSTALYALHRIDAPADQELARATTEAVDVNDAPDVEDTPPQFNEVERAGEQHAGLTTSDLASHTIPSEKYAPFWSEQANVTPSFAVVNSSQARLGTAAQRESAGQFGHGTMQIMMGIEPVIREGAVFGLDYFEADHPGIQPFAGNYMEQAPGYDRDVTGALAGRAANTSHAAVASGYMSQWAGATMTGAWSG